MFKNAVIAILVTIIHAMWIGEFSFLAFISLATILFLVVWQIEEKINEIKSMKVFQRRISRKIDEIKITHTPSKVS